MARPFIDIMHPIELEILDDEREEFRVVVIKMRKMIRYYHGIANHALDNYEISLNERFMKVYHSSFCFLFNF